MRVQQRFIEPFEKGEWKAIAEKDLLNIPKDVEIIEFVDSLAQQVEIEKMVERLENLKQTSGFNPNKTKEKNKIDMEIENLLLKQKPVGSKIRFTVKNLDSNTMYEFRTMFFNGAGGSVFSLPSHRAKTNEASLPNICEKPVLLDVQKTYALFEIKIPFEGGSTVHSIHFEILNIDDNVASRKEVFQRGKNDLKTMQCCVKNLRLQCSYIFRCKAESYVGIGGFSEWTEEIKLSVVDTKK